VDRSRDALGVDHLAVVGVTASSLTRAKPKMSAEVTKLTAPAIMRMTPTVERRKPWLSS
jgi:hypothetical protein